MKLVQIGQQIMIKLENHSLNVADNIQLIFT